MSEPCFPPWEGSDYRVTSNRLLVLGESHYGDFASEADTFDLTARLTQEYVDGRWNHRFWTNIMQVVLGRPHWEIDRADFWGGVAFYNYVQQLVAESAGVPPTPAMFASSKDAFFSVLAELGPKTILVLSKRLWINLPSEGYEGPELIVDGIQRETWIYPYRGGNALASWVPHPSYGFSWNRWHPWVTALRKLGANFNLSSVARTEPI